MTKREIKDYLQDILEAMDAAESFIDEMSFEDFKADRKTIFAVTRAIEIIGEAAKSITPTLRSQYPQVPWKSITGMRDKLIYALPISTERLAKTGIVAREVRGKIS